MNLHPSAKKHLSRVKNYQPGKPIEEVEREYGVKNAVKMASNENALGPSPKAITAAKKALSRVHRYPDGGCYYLRKKLASRLKVAPETLVFGNGSDEILVLAARAFAGPGDEVLTAEPTFLIYEIAGSAEDARVVKVPMRDFRYDLPAMAKALTPKTKLVFIANPDNPVGTFVTEKEVVTFMDKVSAKTVVVLDEAYYEFAAAKKGYPDAFKLLKRYPNLVVSRTFSKAYGLSGLRVGYGVASAPVVNALNKVREPFNVNLVAQEAAIAALDDRAHLKKTIRMVEEGRKQLAAEFRRMNLGTIETATNFVLADLGRDAKGVYEALLRKGVIVRGMGAWGMPNYIRVTVGRRAENARFVKALKETMRGAVLK